MKISASLKRELNKQVALEAAASSTYLAMASWCEATGYEGGAAYFYAQSAEERDHMLKLVRYLNDMGAGAVIPAIPQPVSSYRSLESVVKAALKGERTVTRAIHKMADAAQKQKDHSTYAFLEWFVNEQVQEETKFETLLQKFDLIGRDKIAVNEIDKMLAADAAAAAQAPA